MVALGSRRWVHRPPHSPLQVASDPVTPQGCVFSRTSPRWLALAPDPRLQSWSPSAANMLEQMCIFNVRSLVCGCTVTNRQNGAGETGANWEEASSLSVTYCLFANLVSVSEDFAVQPWLCCLPPLCWAFVWIPTDRKGCAVQEWRR